jgi:hypothetical protein
MESGYRYDIVKLSDDTSQIRYRYDAVKLSDDTLVFGHWKLFSIKHDSRHDINNDNNSVFTNENRYARNHKTAEFENVY